MKAMAKTKSELRKWLDGLAIEAADQTRLYDSSINKLYHCLASLYMWWREAQQYEGFLDELYAEFNITTRRKNEENFVRVIRLTWRIDWDGSRGASLQKWSKALKEIHHEYETNKEKYKFNSVDSLILFIRSSGGVSGLIKDKTESDEESNDDDKKKPLKNKNKSQRQKENEARLKVKNKELAELYFEKDAKAITKLELNESAVATNDKSYAIALIRKKNDSYQVLSITENDDLIADAMIRTYARQQDSAPMTLRLINEVIQTQAHPIEFEKFRHSLSLRSKVKDENNKPMKQIRRLIYRANSNDFLLSENRADCSVVTIAKPKDFKLNVKDDIFLSANDRTFVEQEIIQKRNLAFYEIVGNKELVENKDEEVKASHFISSKYKIDGYIRNLYFYKTSTIKEGNKQQAIFKPNEVPSWQAEINKEWVSQFNVRFLVSWLRSFGSSVNQRRNQVLRLDVGKQLTVNFDGENGVFSRHIKDFTKMDHVRGKELKLHFHARDLIPTLCALAEQDVIGKIKLAANEFALVFNYKTAICEYSIAIPTTKKNGTRNKQSFTSVGDK
jgi:hypothetical protein